MQHECRITVLETKCFPELQEQYLTDPKSGPCPFFKPGDSFLLKRTPQQDDFYHLMNGKFCGEAWDAVSRYVYAALQGGSIIKGWTKDDRMMIACCNDGTRPVIFKIERIDIRRMTRSGSGWRSRTSGIQPRMPIRGEQKAESVISGHFSGIFQPRPLKRKALQSIIKSG